ncbi:MAG: hypothetical protein SGARI_006710, partial [Bacillariaceae sp.]
MDIDSDDDGSSVGEELLAMYAKMEEQALARKREQEAAEGCEAPSRSDIERNCPTTEGMSAPLIDKIVKTSYTAADTSMALDSDSTGSSSSEESFSDLPASHDALKAKSSQPPASTEASKPSQTSKASPFFLKASSADNLSSSSEESDSDDELENIQKDKARLAVKSATV